MYQLQECSNGANSANVNSLSPSRGEQDDLPSDTAAIEGGDDEGPPTIEMPVPLESELPQPALLAEVLSVSDRGSPDQSALAAEPPGSGSTPTSHRQRLQLVGCIAGLIIAGMVVVAVTHLLNTPAEPLAGTGLPQAGRGPHNNAGRPPTPGSDAIELTGTPSAQPSVTGSAAAASPSPSSPVGGVPSVPDQPVQSTPPVSPAGPPPAAELRAVYRTVERTGRARLRGEVVVSNVSDTTAVRWQVTIRLPEGAIVSTLDDVEFAQAGSTVRFTPRGNTRDIAPGRSVRFTFEVRRSKGGEPTGCFINDRPCG